MNQPALHNDGMGALLTNGTVRFRVWAPNASRVQVMGDFTPSWDAAGAIDLWRENNGSNNWSADEIPASAGQMYQYIITNSGQGFGNPGGFQNKTDARALQVVSSSATSAGYIVDPAVFTANRQPFDTPAFGDFILYQLHVGSFCGRGDGVTVAGDTATFVQAIDKLDYIKGLGFNAIALLPVSNANHGSTGVGLGYGASDMYASEDAYASSPQYAVAELIRLIDAAHSKGLAVFFDMVYNHPDSSANRYWEYDGNNDNGGIYFKNGQAQTGFGQGFALWCQQVKDFFLDNSRMYLRDYRVDGLRFDAVQCMQSDAVAYIVKNLRNEYPNKYLFAEYSRGDSNASLPLVDPIADLGFCAQWDMDGAWDTFKLLGGDNVLYYLGRRIGTFQNPNPWNEIVYLTGCHDQIFRGSDHHAYIADFFGGRMNGYACAKARLAWAFNVTLPGNPMLFMGTEGHLDGSWDPDLANGDRRMNWFQVGDNIGAPMQRMVRDINNLRWNHDALRSPSGLLTHQDPDNSVVGFKRYTLGGEVLLVVVNAGNNSFPSYDYSVFLAGDSGTWLEIFNSQAPDYGGVGTVGNYGAYLTAQNGQLAINLPSWSVLIFKKQ